MQPITCSLKLGFLLFSLKKFAAPFVLAQFQYQDFNISVYASVTQLNQQIRLINQS